MDDRDLFWMLSFLGGELCAERAGRCIICVAFFERRFSCQMCLPLFLSHLSDDKHKAGGDRKLGLGCADALFVPGRYGR